MLYAVRRAIAGYFAGGWEILVKRAMDSDNTWAKSANEYIKLYKSLMN
jgi:starch synthase